MTKSDYVAAYLSVIRAMQEGKFDLRIPADPDDNIGKLGIELHKLAAGLEKKFEETNRLQKITEDVTAGLFLDDVLNRVYDSFRPIIPYDRMGCALLNDGGQALVAYWARSEAANVRIKRGYTAQMAGSSLQAVIETGLPRTLNDLEAYLAEHPDSASTKLIVAEGMHSSLTCPLVAQGKPVGFLFFSSMERNTYRSVHQETFLQVANQISLLIEKSRLYEQLYELNQKLLLAQKELQQQATHDALTGVYNRAAIFGLLEAQLSRAQRHGRMFCIIMVDVDHFKQINDAYGHLAGDLALKEVAAALSGVLRKYDHIGRYGGEEFLIVLDEENAAAIIRTAERLRLAVDGKTIEFSGKQFEVTISAGVMMSDNPAGIDLDRSVAAADEALYEAKRNGRNRVEVRRI